jgi:RNA polymerase sigma factor (sigma-70 family)
MRLRQPNDREALSLFVRLYFPLLARYAECLPSTRALSAQDREDLIHDVFLRLFELLPRYTYKPGRSFRSLLRKIVANKAIDLLRRRKCLPAATQDLSFVELSGPTATALFEKEEYETYLIERASEIVKDEFEPATWEAVWEFVAKDRLAAEVARQFGKSVDAIYAGWYRIRKRLEEVLKGLLEE